MSELDWVILSSIIGVAVGTPIGCYLGIMCFYKRHMR
jgi:ABC-type microcin C transport system permease subunit YejE